MTEVLKKPTSNSAAKERRYSIAWSAGSSAQVANVLQWIWGIVIFISTCRCTVLISLLLPNHDLLFGLAFLFVPLGTLTQVTILAVAMGWSVGNTKQGWRELQIGVLVLVSVELVCFLCTIFLTTLRPRTEHLFLTNILGPLAFLLLHGVPVFLLVAMLRSKGLEIVNASLPHLPCEAMKWQFRIRDMMIAALVVSLSLAPLQFLDGRALWETIAEIHAWPILVFAMGSVGVVLMVALANVTPPAGWFYRPQTALVGTILISVLQGAVGRPYRLLGASIAGYLAVNILYLAILQALWKWLASSGWRIVQRESSEP